MFCLNKFLGLVQVSELIFKEAQSGQSRKDFKSKMYIAYKEASETEYWLELLHESDILQDNLFESLYNDNYEILSLLISITKTLSKECKK